MGSPTCPYCMQRADRCACEDPRIVGYENATPTPPAPADGIQHDMETRCPKCGQDYRLHKGDEVECVCPAPADDASVKQIVVTTETTPDGRTYAPADDAGGERRASTDALRRIARAAKPFAFYTRSLSENPGEYVMRVPRAEADEIQRAVDAIWGTDDYATDDAGGALMPKDVPGAAEFRDAFKAAVLPRGADHASWVNGYCAGWIACEKAFPLPARDDAVEEAMAPGCHEHVALWDAINAYSAACGGHPTRGGGARMDAVVRVEKALRAALRGTRPEGHGGGK